MRISLLIDSPLAVLMHAMRGLDSDVRREIAKQSKINAQPIWTETLQGHAATRLQTRLARSGRVGVTQANVFLRAGGVGKLPSGSPVSAVAKATEFGMNATTQITTISGKGKIYDRRAGNAFGPRNRNGNTAYPAARESLTRIGSLWVQTAVRTIHEKVESI